MSTVLIEIRRAKASDAAAVADTHDEAWRGAYQGVIPGVELEKLVTRRGADWWDSAIRKGSRIAILAFGDKVAGYANYGRNRARSLFYDGEIYELYLRPEYQGLGFGRRLFSSARRDLAQSGLKSLVIWALSDNDPAMELRLGPCPATAGLFIFRCWSRGSSVQTARAGNPAIVQAARTVLTIRQAMVIGPTPPGTGVIAPATCEASAKLTSPTSFDLPPGPGTRLMPTSITVAPGLIQSPRTISGRPIAATSRSALRHTAGKSRVLEWAIVTVAFSAS